jgi:tetratricopeptide (TPR) repeat protein
MYFCLLPLRYKTYFGILIDELYNMHKFLAFVLLFITFGAQAQSTDEQLAAQYMADSEFDKAQVLYEKLLKKNPESIYFYQNYFQCLTNTKDFDGAEKLIKKQSKRYPENAVFLVDQGVLLQMQDKNKEADVEFNGILKLINTDEEKTIHIANAFVSRNLTVWAAAALLAGRKAAGYETAFSNELIALYQKQGQWKKVVDESLVLLSKNDNDLGLVQGNLIRMLDRRTDVDYLREKTLLYLQKYPNKIVYDQLMLWVFLQNKDYRAAYRQAVAMDKKGKDEGLELLNLAATCLNNDQYDIAIDCYNTVMLRGKQGYFYLNAHMGLLETRYTKISKSYAPTDADLKLLEQDYLAFLTEYGRSFNTSNPMKQLADFYIYYFHDLNKGIALLEELAVMQRVQPKFNAACKLSLGDAYLIRGDIWDAQLLYAQVDKDFAEDPLGQEAKLRNAKVSYYTGDFDWAKDQLDVLKTATSQLISNNAIELALKIQDNTGLDSTTEALKKFADAELLYFQNKLDQSLTILNLMPFLFPRHSLEDDIYLLKARIFVKKGNFEEAEKNYTVVFNKFGGDILADNALMELARIYEYQTNQKVKAMTLYKKVVFTYTGSLYTVEARKRIQALKDEGVTDEKP